MTLEALLGKRTKYDIVSDSGLLLVPARAMLDPESIRLLRQHRVHHSDVYTIAGEEPEAESPAESIREASEYSKDLFDRIRASGEIPAREIERELIPIVREASRHPDLFRLFESVKAKDEYTHRHNIGVGVLSAMIGRWMGLDEEELALLALAATLHDVGKVRIPEEILLKPGKLTEEEFAEMKRHAAYGYELLAGTSGLSPRVALVALQHHERTDGSGYPQRLRSSETDPMSRIVAVADVFHAMSSRRPYHEPLPFHEVVARMRHGAFGELDPNVVTVFLNNLIRHLIGRSVKLTDGRWGVVVRINPHDDTRPLVRVNREYIDLSVERHLQIQEIIV
ncbi:HD-GYP domain-containing protein [Cohnella xylanilytica]|uniref:HD-GYP domain-containing protein n=1 Tax=Cohnella xylanilytica TaxID=557555 RepID=UPI0021AA0A29|nr:HD-GYP domain-containing protein [Cohnella xylanilytica]